MMPLICDLFIEVVSCRTRDVLAGSFCEPLVKALGYRCFPTDVRVG